MAAESPPKARKSVSFTPSQTGSSSSEVPLAWTANPFKLLMADMQLCLTCIPYAAVILWPMPSHETDELYPTVMNMWTLGVHSFLVFYQTIYLLTIPALLLLQAPGWICIAFLATGFAFNLLVSKFLLNGFDRFFNSRVDLSGDKPHPNEQWIFCNGVAVGHHWLQSNLDRLALTFRRPVRGILNETNGILFDLIQCLIERNFAYPTLDVRSAYRQIKTALLDESKEKIVLILHSQGGIQGSLVVDWLLDEFPHSLLNKLEIYTFGNAANHFNNPHRDLTTYRGTTASAKAISHIEHYGNDWDFVARWGVFHYTSIRNRYMGRIFRAPISGHLLNQHYLSDMFPLGKDKRVKEHNEFMDAEVGVEDCEEAEAPLVHGDKGTESATVNGDGDASAGADADDEDGGRDSRESVESSCYSASMLGGWGKDGDEEEDGGDVQLVEDVDSPVQRVAKRASGTLRVKDFSRLWQYRDGGSPLR